MHPTADTTAVMYLQSLGAAGDAGRSAANEVIERKARESPVMTERSVLFIAAAMGLLILCGEVARPAGSVAGAEARGRVYRGYETSPRAGAAQELVAVHAGELDVNDGHVRGALGQHSSAVLTGTHLCEAEGMSHAGSRMVGSSSKTRMVAMRDVAVGSGVLRVRPEA